MSGSNHGAVHCDPAEHDTPIYSAQAACSRLTHSILLLTGCGGAAHGGHQVRGGCKRVAGWVWAPGAGGAWGRAVQRKASKPAGQLLHLPRSQLLRLLLWGGRACRRGGQRASGQATQYILPSVGGGAQNAQRGGEAVPAAIGTRRLGDAHLCGGGDGMGWEVGWTTSRGSIKAYGHW